MSSLFLVLSLVLVFTLSISVCITVNVNVKWYNLVIGSLILYFCFLFSYLLSANIFYVVVVAIFACLYNSFFYTNYIISPKNILIFFIYLSYILFIEGVKSECYNLFFILERKWLNILIVLFSIILLLTIAIILKFCVKKVRLASYIYHARVVFKECAVCLDLFLDSGNMLTYGEEKLPVIVVSNKKLRNLNLEGVENFQISGISGESKNTLIVIPTFFEIHIKGRWREKTVAICIVEREFVFYDGLLGLDIIY